MCLILETKYKICIASIPSLVLVEVSAKSLADTSDEIRTTIAIRPNTRTAFLETIVLNCVIW